MTQQEEIQKLIHRSKQGDTAAFSLLVSTFQQLVFRLAFRLVCNEDEAKDITQETFVKVWLALDSYHSNYQFSTWIYKIACNSCYDHLRTLRHSPLNNESVDICSVAVSSNDDIESVLINKQLKELILQYTCELPPTQRLIFTLRDIEELDVPEVHTITGLSAGVIKSTLYLARKNIRDRMKQIDTDL